MCSHIETKRGTADFCLFNSLCGSSLSGSIIDFHAQDGFLKYKNNNKIYEEDFLMEESWLMVFVEPFVIFEFHFCNSVGELMAINTSLLICSPEVKGQSNCTLVNVSNDLTLYICYGHKLGVKRNH